ncbi:type II toxin-antitoxin system RelE/ParE family toxin [Chlorogloea sp. CCALA 695]|uniref:type II toxin-antitoxin system RelE/ParE family toxin n=1 Tax=Chlorogloea sp. CCALA 695 TaxID=2107693 RepID=UPI000D06A870|nr:type II toxin-antitoxin system RelE/ParE family toxin [Chlorogloea sp. CCALA 695]PSB30250.1 plasmid maintenance system killer protein [Chlorogloea sp. CCALA 695]
MILSFKDVGTQDIFNGENTKSARKTCPQTLFDVAFRKLDQIDSAVELNDLRVPLGNRLEALKGDRTGQHSIRINDQYRICFILTNNGATEVEILDYH